MARSSLSFSDFLPCTTWFSSATRCSRRLLISLRLAASSLRSLCSRSSVATELRWPSGMAAKSISGSADMPRIYPETTGNARFFDRPSHSAAAGRRASSGVTRRQSNPANRASNCTRLSTITPPRMAGQVKLVSSSRL